MQSIFIEHHAWAMRVAVGVTGNTHDAEDVVSEVFLALHRARQNGGGPTANVRSYLRRSIQNEMTRLWARRRHETVLETLPEQVQPDPAEAALRALQRRMQLQNAPSTWPLVLFHIDVLGESAEETAALCELTVGSVRSILHRARLALRLAA